jgi:Ca2+-binding EF-hand superfamily protein
MDIVWSDKEIEEAVKDIDKDANGLIDIKEFISWYSALDLPT